jgi:hypothetical protein
MEIKDFTLGEQPFNFDISWPFPSEDREILIDSVHNIKIYSPEEVPLLEEKLSKKLNKFGYIWDSDNREKCMLWRPDYGMSVDFYNEEKKIAVEVEKTEVKRIIHDFLKLVNGSLTFVPKIKYGVIIYPQNYLRISGKKSIFASRVVSEINFYFKHLIAQSGLKDVLFVVYNFDQH